MSLSADIGEDEVKLDSKFQKRMVIYDMNKTAFDVLSQSKGNYIIIDLIDDRFALAKYKNSIVTFSSCAENGGFKDKVNILNYYEYNNKFYFQGFDIDIYLDQFCKRIKNI